MVVQFLDIGLPAASSVRVPGIKRASDPPKPLQLNKLFDLTFVVVKAVDFVLVSFDLRFQFEDF